MIAWLRKFLKNEKTSYRVDGWEEPIEMLPPRNGKEWPIDKLDREFRSTHSKHGDAAF